MMSGICFLIFLNEGGDKMSHPKEIFDHELGRIEALKVDA